MFLWMGFNGSIGKGFNPRPVKKHGFNPCPGKTIFIYLFFFFIQILIKIETSGFRYWNGNKI